MTSQETRSELPSGDIRLVAGIPHAGDTPLVLPGRLDPITSSALSDAPHKVVGSIHIEEGITLPIVAIEASDAHGTGKMLFYRRVV